MANLIDIATSHARTVLLVLLFIIVSGVASYISIPIEAAPDIKIPMIHISIRLDGVSPPDAERLLVRPMEKELKTISSVKKITSEANEGVAAIILEFEAGFDSDRALQDVRAKVDEVKKELPDDAEEPEVSEINLSLFPIINVILTGEGSDRVMYGIARDLRDKMESLSAVLKADIFGDREEVLGVIINPLTLENYNISPTDVLNRIRSNNVLIAAGDLDDGKGRFGIKLSGLIETYADLMDTVIINDKNTVVKLSDVAAVRRSFKDRGNYVRVNGKNAIGIGVSKRTGANIIDTVTAVKELVEKERQFWPSGIDVIYSQDNSNTVKERLSDLENNIILAIILVMLVIMLVMGLGAAVIVAFAIPATFLIGILFLNLFGMTLNVVVLFSLILSVGMLVDSAIVVSEYADRKIKEGVGLSEAYILASKRMAWPIIASTITTLVVFMPLLFWPGIVGQFMKYMPLTLMVVLTGSLAMALVFIPTIMTLFNDKITIFNNNKYLEQSPNSQRERSSDKILETYQKLLKKVLRKPAIFSFVVVIIMIFSIMSFGIFGSGVEFFPNMEPDNANIIIRTEGNLSIDEMNQLAKELEQKTKGLSDEIRVFYTRAGKMKLQNFPIDTIAIIQLEFQKWNTRRKAEVILNEIKHLTKDMAGVIVEAAKQKEGPPTGKDIQLEFNSRFPDIILPEVQKFKKAMAEIGGFINIEDDTPLANIEWEFSVNRELAGRNNISMVEIGQLIKLVSNGIIVNQYRPDDSDDEIDIIVRFPKDSRVLSQFERLRVQTKDGLVPISNFVKRKAKQSSGVVKRVNNLRAYTIKADLKAGIVIDSKVGEVKQWLANADIDPRVNIVFRGQDEDQAEAASFLKNAFMIALFLMCLVLVTQFNSIFYMLVIMSAVFLSTAGVFLGLLVTNQSFGIVMSGVGVISLAGIVVNNNIIFVDTYVILRKRGLEVADALVQAGSERLRPILLTAGTTVLGLLPMVVGLNLNFVSRSITLGSPSSQWWTQLSTSIAGGLAFATILTLFFTPAIIYMFDGRKNG